MSYCYADNHNWGFQSRWHRQCDAGRDRDARLRGASDVASRPGGNSGIWHGLSSSRRHFAAEALVSATAFSHAALLARLLHLSPKRQSRSRTQEREPLTIPAHAERRQFLDTVESEQLWLNLNKHRRPFVGGRREQSMGAWRDHGVR
jgi:hypothetical protein